MEYRRAVSKAQIKDVDGISGLQPLDSEGFLLFPKEDFVPYRSESSDEEELIIPQ